MSTTEERCSCRTARRSLAVVTPTNVPGLSAVVYRIGRHGDIKARLLAGLSDKERPQLAGLQTRSDDDFTIALLDAFASMADVLTFYQERIANESYLRTATERRSVLELARLTGYRPSPGVAAEVELAFTLEDAPGAAEPPVQETTIPVGTQVRSVPGPDETAQTFETVEAITARYEWNALEPTTTEPQSIDKWTREVWIDGANLSVRVGQGLLLRCEGGNDIFRTIVAVQPDTVRAVTCITLSAAVGDQVDTATSECFLLHQRAAVFGHNAPNPCLLHITEPELEKIYDSVHCEWKEKWELSGPELDLDAAYSGISRESYCVLEKPDDFKVCRIDQLAEVSLSDFALSGKVTRLKLSTAFKDDPPGTLANFARESGEIGSAKPRLVPLFEHCLNGFNRRETSVYLQSEQLTLSDSKPLPPNYRVECFEIKVQGPLQNLPAAGQHGVLLEADGKGGWAPREMISIQSCDEDPDTGAVTLRLAEPLAGSYKPAEVRINLNIARATHGETVQEILGDGDARAPSQRFALKQRPLTYVPTETPAGSESTLEVRVDELLWRARESFVDAGPRERVYTRSIADDGTVSLRFGDGINGARLPSGQSNVRARYRKGTGVGGLVGARQLSLLMSRPLGVKAVINPEPASGAEDPETLETARGAAPTRVLTLDRVVSLQDYEDYARTFPGIAKARADVHPTQPDTVFVTVAGANGAKISKGSELAKRLGKALLDAGNPHLTIQVRPCRRVWLELAVRIEVQPDALEERVAHAVRGALVEAFSYERAVLGGRIWRSEIVALIQGVPGVAAVDIACFARKIVRRYAMSNDCSGGKIADRLVDTPAISMAVKPAIYIPASVLTNRTNVLIERPPDPRSRLSLPRRWFAVPHLLSASPADPERGLGAELLTLHPTSLKVEIVDAL
jgi:hypothetical protein